MNIKTTTQPPQDCDADAVVVTVWKDSPLFGAAKDIDVATDGALGQLIETGEISTDRLALATLLSPVGVTAQVVVVVGLGTPDAQNKSLSGQAIGAAAKLLAGKQRESVAFYVDDLEVKSAVAGAIVGCVGEGLYQHEQELHSFETALFFTQDQAAIDEGTVVGESQNVVRKLVNMPANDLYPESFAQKAIAIGADSGFDVEVWDEKRLEQERCGAFLAVGRASALPPRLVIMQYKGGKPDQKPLGLVGKGVTFDSGGLSIKTSDGMIAMKCDMAGAATVLGAMKAIAELKLPGQRDGLCWAGREHDCR